ncbi:MAG TPA: tRNA uridine-5-carboxymethylaminomethyl(34) synthesis enzyme MnmG, partial [Candidatus Binatia bacterium]|nr:tRNA uridine-5-carboxymethylaminomethyl(34) synthesis enzyme MnmG [Candidatus Binatia bacterium]
TIDFDRLQVQRGDDPPVPFSFATEKIAQKQVPCHITYTNHRTHEAIRASLHRSPIYSGIIHSRGPRYCPSIEDKIVRFADKERHQIFLEPEGLDTVEIYPNGLSTSLPLDAQIEMVHSIEGLERAEIMRPGYAIEYDYAEPTQLYPSLETKVIKNLYHAGQINGTTGYEEAAAQGLMAGLNAALSLRGEEPLIFKRDEAYIAVLIDDLVTKGTDGEPYRMFTSRAEYRLLLREDNADLRLTEIGHKIGAVSGEAYARLERKRDGVAVLLRTLEHTTVNPEEIKGKIEAFGSAPVRGGTTLAQLLKRPEIGFAELREFAPNLEDIPLDIALQAEVETKYAGYIDRQLEAVKRAKNFESVGLPEDIDYAAVTGLSREAREKLARIRPRSLGQASRIAGITPAAISLLSIYLHKRKIAVL